MRPLDGVDGYIGDERDFVDTEPRLPLGFRLLVILGTCLIGWALPAYLLYLLW